MKINPIVGRMTVRCAKIIGFMKVIGRKSVVNERTSLKLQTRRGVPRRDGLKKVDQSAQGLINQRGKALALAAQRGGQIARPEPNAQGTRMQ